MKITALFMALIAAIQAFFGIAPKPPVIDPDHEHVYEAQTVAPTCTEEGCVLYLCACGESYKESVVPAEGHIWDAQPIIEPTTWRGGIYKLTCLTCNVKKIVKAPKFPKEHTHLFTVEDTTRYVEPTCTSFGKRFFACEHDCGAFLEEAVGMLPHDYRAVNVIDPTCEDGGYTEYACSGCGLTTCGAFLNPLGHDYSEWVVTTPATDSAAGIKTHTCTRCNKTEYVAIQPNSK